MQRKRKRPNKKHVRDKSFAKAVIGLGVLAGTIVWIILRGPVS